MSISIALEAGVMSLGFNRPEKKNALTAAMYLDMTRALEQAEADDAVRVILFHGSEVAFTAGNDLEDFLKAPPASQDAPAFRFIRAISQVAKPIVAAVCGPAVGLGTTMLLHCDLVYAAETAKFSLPFTALGLVPEAAATLLLPMFAGHPLAAEKLLLGETFGAAEAQRLGLVGKLMPAAEVLPYARLQADKLVALPEPSLRITKRLMKQGQADAVAARMADEASEFIALLRAPEAKEAFAAFFERRKPDFAQFGRGERS